MKSVAIVQARMTSTRLPGKVLEEIAGQTVLRHVLGRCRWIPGIDGVCCAVPEGAEHDPVAEEALSFGVEVTRGPDADVLARYCCAAEAMDADVVMRVTSDCPLIDPGVCGQVLSALLADDASGYAANNFTRRFPHGLDCEAMRRSSLELASRRATDAYEREHVTPWLRHSPEVSRVAVDGPDPSLANIRWTLDYPEDLEFLRAFMPLLGKRIVDWREALSIFHANANLAPLNSRRAQF